MPTENDPLTRRPRPEHEWHTRIRERNEEVREALEVWLADGNTRRLKKAVALVAPPPFAPPPSPRLTHETERLLATVLRALLVPASPKRHVREQWAYRQSMIGRTV